MEGSGRVGFGNAGSPGIPGIPGSPGRDGDCKRRRASAVFLAPVIPESDKAVKKRKTNSFGLVMLSVECLLVWLSV